MENSWIAGRKRRKQVYSTPPPPHVDQFSCSVFSNAGTLAKFRMMSKPIGMGTGSMRHKDP